MDYIADTLGVKVVSIEKSWVGVENLQYFLIDAYDFKSASIGNVKCLLIKPKGEIAAIPSLKKHFGIIAKKASVPIVLDIPAINAKQRKALVAARIPFVVEGNQLYLPFLGAAIQERYVNPVKIVETLSPSAQLVLFYYLYKGSPELYTNVLSEALGISAMQITRAVKQLAALDLFTTRKDGVKIIMSGTENGIALFEKSKTYLVNPVRQRFYVDNDALPYGLPYAGETALGEYTMLAPPQTSVYAYHGKASDLAGTDTLVDPESQSQVEIWRYSPTVLSQKKNCVDLLSLWTSITNEDNDPRLDIVKDVLLEEIWRNG
jgi:DNA-binding MarR family transcriptional regulator